MNPADHVIEGQVRITIETLTPQGWVTGRKYIKHMDNKEFARFQAQAIMNIIVAPLIKEVQDSIVVPVLEHRITELALKNKEFVGEVK